jgi:hypothetical protein
MEDRLDPKDLLSSHFSVTCRTVGISAELTYMYGPPSDCKGKVSRRRKSASMYPACLWRLSLLAMMRYAAYLSFETPRPYKGHLSKQASGAPF